MINKTRIFLDAGSAEDSKKAISIYPELDGQTTNPTIISKNKFLLDKIESGRKFDINNDYKKIIQQINNVIPKKSISIEVYADAKTTASEMLDQGQEFNKWVPNAYIKLPLTEQGIIAAQSLIKNDVNVNMTLNFSLKQAFALHLACEDILKNSNADMLISPFIGRLDDINQDGLQLAVDIQNLFENINSEIKVLASSIRSYQAIKQVISNEIDIITIPSKYFTKKIYDYFVSSKDQSIRLISDTSKFIDQYQNTANWKDIDIRFSMTDSGLEKFANDWNNIQK